MTPQQQQRQANRIAHETITARYESITHPDAHTAIAQLIEAVAAMTAQIARLVEENNSLSRALTIANPNHRILKKYQDAAGATPSTHANQ